jgi:L-asparaginase II
MKEDAVIAYRNNVVESIHRVAVALVDSSGKLLYSAGDPSFITFLRSSAKPFQAVPVVESGAAEAFGFSQKEIAIIAGSHNGEKKHVRTVQGILKKIGMNSSYLQCGAHVPHYYTALGITPPRKKFSPLEHNCSGKHAGMLAICVYKGWNLKNYLDPKHPVQKLDLRIISELCEYPEKKIGIGIENCGAPTFALPLRNMAIGFAKLRSFRSKREILSQSLQVVADSMWKYPEMVSGRGRLDYVLAVASKGNILSKGGAEALHCSVVLDKGYGLAVKIMDGSGRAIAPAAIEVYKQLGVLNRNQLRELADFYLPPVYNHRKKKVGFLKAEFKLHRNN